MNESVSICVGLDEAGRGPLAGPVLAGAVILDKNKPIRGLADSKKLTHLQRVALLAEIKEKALAWSIGRADVVEIDTINILQASLLAMQRAYDALNMQAQLALVDGKFAPKLSCQTCCIIKGDSKIAAISAASIVAKVLRDEEMCLHDKQYPMYGFAQHKGYPTKQHLHALHKYGVCHLHRRSFAPVRRVLSESITN